MPREEASIRWSAFPARESESIWRAWDGEIVVRVGASGDTHHLSRLASSVFLILNDSGASLPVHDILARLTTESGERAGDLVAPVDAVLTELERIGIIRSDPA